MICTTQYVETMVHHFFLFLLLLLKYQSLFPLRNVSPALLFLLACKQFPLQTFIMDLSTTQSHKPVM